MVFLSAGADQSWKLLFCLAWCLIKTLLSFQDWGEKAKKSVEPSENDETESSSQEGKKRKRDEEEEEEENKSSGLEKRPKSQELKTKTKTVNDGLKKKPLASATNAKLAGFAFGKKD